MIVLAGAFSLLYLWFTFFPGPVAPGAWQYFSAEQINQGRQYNGILRLVYITGFLAQAAFLLWLAFGGRGIALSRWTQWITKGNFWASLMLFFLLLWLLLQLLNLPFTFFSGYFWQRHWGFSTQTLGHWWMDYFKSSSIELFLSAAGVAALFWAMRRWPATWWLAGAVFISLWIVVQAFLWPVVISPLFNRFEPAKDPEVLSIVQELSAKAGLPVDRVLIMDASRRTTRANAYFTGLGKTKRIVLYDTLLANYSPEEIKAVVAHEMAHWRQGHIMRGLAMGILGNFLLWGFLYIILRTTLPAPVSTRYPAFAWSVILLFFLLVFFVSNPLQNYFSRGMEEEADRVSIMLTGDAAAAIRLQVNLSARNKEDVSPPVFIQWFSYTHPPVLKRIEIMQ